MRELVLVVLAGCGSFIDNQAATSTYRILEKSFAAAKRLPDVELARDAMPGGILQLQSFALAYPTHSEFARLYADTVCQYATGFVFDAWEDAQLGRRPDEAGRIATRLTTLFEMCVEAELAVLPPAWRVARRTGGEAWTAALARATPAEAPRLLSLASVDAEALALDPMGRFATLDAIDRTLERCAQLAPGAHDAAAELLLGTLAAARLQSLGGDDGAALFARARKLAGEGALIVDVMFARGTAVARHDRALFEATLRAVLAADVTRWPDRRLGNELARAKARRYLAAADQLVP